MYWKEYLPSKFTAFRLRCVDGSECAPSQRIVAATFYAQTFCKPIANLKDGRSSSFASAKQLLESTVEKVKHLKWLRYGSKCNMYENFDSSWTTHTESKDLIIQSYIDEDSKIWMKGTRMCNPFENEECHPQRKKCECAQYFIRQDGECRLTPGNTSQHSCEWKPQLYSEEMRARTHLQNLDLGQVVAIPCIENSVCLPTKDGENHRKTCVCNEGETCENWKPVSKMGKSTSRPAKQAICIYILIMIICLTFTY
jgi:hypothetical protein